MLHIQSSIDLRIHSSESDYLACRKFLYRF